MAVLDGVRVGPLDPDRGEDFGHVGGQATARQLIRHHVALNPPALQAALNRRRQQERSDAIDAAEAEKVARKHYKDVGEALPDEAELTGFAVRGEDDKPKQQVLTFTYALESGRTGKGFVPYNSDTVPKSVKAGDEAVRVAKLKEAGLPWQAEATAQAESKAGRELEREAESLRERVAELEGKLRDVEEQRPSVEEQGGRTPADAEQAQSGPPAEPYEGYDGENARDIAKYVRDQDDQQLAQAVLNYEEANQNRKGVVGAANSVLNRKPAS